MHIPIFVMTSCVVVSEVSLTLISSRILLLVGEKSNSIDGNPLMGFSLHPQTSSVS